MPRVKAEHQKPAGLLQPMLITDWKWDKLDIGFHHWITQDPIRIRFYLGSSGSLDQSGPLYPHENHLYEREVGQDLEDQDRMSAWSYEDHRIR